jgi:hypothetical protein
MAELDRLRSLTGQFVLGCHNWYLLRLWQECGSFEKSSVHDRIRVAEEVLASPHRGTVAWAQGGSIKLVDLLISRLTDAAAQLRQEAAIALADERIDGRHTLTILLQRLQSSEVAIHDRVCAAWTIGRIGFSEEQLSALLVVLRSSVGEPEADELRWNCAEAIERHCEDPAVLFEVARLCLLDSFYKCNFAGLSIVRKLGEKGRDLALLVEPLTQHEFAELREESERVLKCFS